MYHSDSRTGKLKVYPYDSESASVESGLPFSEVCEDSDSDEELPVIGSSCTNSLGQVWVGHFFTNLIRLYQGHQSESPSTKILQEI